MLMPERRMQADQSYVESLYRVRGKRQRKDEKGDVERKGQQLN
jgi:hypothetical protein